MTENDLHDDSLPNPTVELQKAIEEGKVSSEGLAAHVVAYRTLGINKTLATACMVELGRRRTNGDEFDFETFIEDEVKKVKPIPEVNLKQLTGNFSIQALLKMIKK